MSALGTTRPAAAPPLKAHEETGTACARLLLASIRPEVDQPELVRAAASVIDWEDFAALSASHDLVPLVYSRLSAACPEAVPESVLAAMRESYLANARKSLLLTAELLRLLDAFGGLGLRVVPFKGPVLAWLAYRNPELRAFSDLDLLVGRADFPAARRLLSAFGYATLSPENLPGGFLDWNEELPLFNPRSGMRVDLHWRPLPAHLPSLPPEYFLEDAVPVEIDGRQVQTFAPEKTFLYLCVHGGKHAWGSLKWLADLAHLAHRRPLNWALILAEARARRVSRFVLLTSGLLEDLLGVQCPIVPEETSARRSRAYRIARNNLLSAARDSDRFRELRFQIRLVEPILDKCRLLGSMLAPTPLDTEKIRLPKTMFGLYYPLRLARLAVDAAGRRLRSGPR
ncbi:MAG: nucleotidyltransferase family protein [Bryobacteraceae bacterium]